jgi:aspartokinase/homoserine dehydrogenase 1
VNVEGGGMVGLQGIAGRIFSTLASARINIIMISQASSEHSICFIVRDEQAAAATRALERELDRELERKQIERVQVERDLEIVAVIGENMRGRPGISGRLFSALGASGVNVLAIAQGSSEMNISFVVHRGDREATLTAVHDAFFQRSSS